MRRPQQPAHVGDVQEHGSGGAHRDPRRPAVVGQAAAPGQAAEARPQRGGRDARRLGTAGRPRREHDHGLLGRRRLDTARPCARRPRRRRGRRGRRRRPPRAAAAPRPGARGCRRRRPRSPPATRRARRPATPRRSRRARPPAPHGGPRGRRRRRSPATPRTSSRGRRAAARRRHRGGRRRGGGAALGGARFSWEKSILFTSWPPPSCSTTRRPPSWASPRRWRARRAFLTRPSCCEPATIRSTPGAATGCAASGWAGCSSARPPVAWGSACGRRSPSSRPLGHAFVPEPVVAENLAAHALAAAGLPVPDGPLAWAGTAQRRSPSATPSSSSASLGAEVVAFDAGELRSRRRPRPRPAHRRLARRPRRAAAAGTRRRRADRGRGRRARRRRGRRRRRPRRRAHRRLRQGARAVRPGDRLVPGGQAPARRHVGGHRARPSRRRAGGHRPRPRRRTRPRRSAAACALTVDAFLDVAARGLHLHGAMGYAWESGCHLFVRRALCTATLLGDTARHRRRALAAFRQEIA